MSKKDYKKILCFKFTDDITYILYINSAIKRHLPNTYASAKSTETVVFVSYILKNLSSHVSHYVPEILITLDNTCRCIFTGCINLKPCNIWLSMISKPSVTAVLCFPYHNTRHLMVAVIHTAGD